MMKHLGIGKRIGEIGTLGVALVEPTDLGPQKGSFLGRELGPRKFQGNGKGW